MKKIPYKYSTIKCASSTPCPYSEKDIIHETGQELIRYVGATSCEECQHFIRDCRKDTKNKYVECGKE